MSFAEFRAMGGRVTAWVLAALLCAAGTSCATVYAPALMPGQSARVKIVGPPDPRLASDGSRAKRKFNVSVHDYTYGCPQVESTRTKKGFRGKIEVTLGATTAVDVPAGRRLTFTSEWSDVVPELPYRFVQPALSPLDQVPCLSVVTFVPAPGRTYVIRYPEVRDAGKRACGATAEIEGLPQTTQGPESIDPHALRGAQAFQSGGLCTLDDH